MSNNIAIIKVGNTSTSRFRNIKCFRAITMTEMTKLSQTYESGILVIEHIHTDEYDRALNFLKSEMDNSSKKIFFYVPDNDDTTTGLADELNLDIYMNIRDLYNAIQMHCGLNVDIDMNINKRDIEYDRDFEGGFDTQFDDTLQAASDALGLGVDLGITEEIVILTREDAGLGLTDITDEELGITVEVSQDEVYEESNDDEVSSTVDSAELKRLKMELTAAIQSGESFRIKAEEAMERVTELNKVVKAVKDERDAFKHELQVIETADIIEDPETLAEFERIKKACVELQEKIDSASSKTSEEVEAIIAERDSILVKLTAMTAEKDALEEKVGELSIGNAVLTKELQDAKNSTELDDKITELTEYSSELQAEIDRLRNIVTELNNKADNLEKQLEEAHEQIAIEISLRVAVNNLLMDAVRKIQSTSHIELEVATLRENLERSNSELARVSAELEDKSAKLEKTIADTETRVELARNFSKDEVEALRRDNIALQTKVTITENQLLAKTTQYDNLIQMTGLDENGAAVIAENNKTLEALNTTLRSQLSELKIAYENSEREKVEMRQSLSTLKDKTDQLNSRLKAMSSGYSGGAGVGVVPPLTYTGRAQIITVFGSGSFGITTTAYTAANMLANHSRVLFVDFDMISAKADTFFRKSPMIKNIPGVSPTSTKSSGLGIMVDRGVPFFLTYAPQIIIPGDRFKGGYIDYLSGFYDRPEVVKLISTDFNSFLNYLGNTYDYIIMDFGRFDASEINNQILKIFCNVARCSVVVTSSDRIDIRNTRIALQSRLKIDAENMAWLVNLAESTKLDDKTKEYLTPARYMAMPMVDDFYGRKMQFTENRVTRDKFRLFLDSNILKR